MPLQPHNTLTIALPKGRMSEECVEYLHKKHVTSLKEFSKTSRKLIIQDKEKNIDFLLIRSQDVGTYVERGAADVGIIGGDLLRENEFAVYSAMELPFGYCELCIAHPENLSNWDLRKHLRVATKYPKLTSHFFYSKGINADLVKLYGSIEIAPITGISDIIVDLVSTGQTLKANKLIRSEPIMKSWANLVVNPSANQFKRELISNLLNLLSK